MSRRFTYSHQTFYEWQSGLHSLNLSPLAWARLCGVNADLVSKWRDGVHAVPIWATMLAQVLEIPEARQMINRENALRLLEDRETGETFGTVERIRR